MIGLGAHIPCAVGGDLQRNASMAACPPPLPAFTLTHKRHLAILKYTKNKFYIQGRNDGVCRAAQRITERKDCPYMAIDLFTIECLDRIKQRAPLIHNITNFVVMNSSANILLAIGASPVMAHCRAEVEEMTALAGALVLNIGTLQEDWLESMICAGKAANAKGIPVIVDPVGAGATRLRTEAVKQIMRACSVTVLRGNASEVLSLADVAVRTKGVDSSLGMSAEIVQAAKEMALAEKCIIAISGEEDCITDGCSVFRVGNGQPLMTKVTGIGCGLTAVTAAFCAVAGADFARATAAAFAFYGLCGDLAIKTSDKPGSFYVAFLDRLYTTGKEEIKKFLKVREE
jgi:hydroxyethylthiazole kinase